MKSHLSYLIMFTYYQGNLNKILKVNNGGPLNFTIGRAKDCSLPLRSGDQIISRRHLEITYSLSRGCFVLTDLGSTNHTYLKHYTTAL